MFGWINVLYSHSILHNAFGRFYNNHELDRGYFYVSDKSYEFMKESPLCGQLAGIIYCIVNKIII